MIMKFFVYGVALLFESPVRQWCYFVYQLLNFFKKKYFFIYVTVFWSPSLSLLFIFNNLNIIFTGYHIWLGKEFIQLNIKDSCNFLYVLFCDSTSWHQNKYPYPWWIPIIIIFLVCIIQKKKKNCGCKQPNNITKVALNNDGSK